MRVLGSEVVGWHDHGELREDRRRIIPVLDIVRAYRHLRARGGVVVVVADLLLSGIGEHIERLAEHSLGPSATIGAGRAGSG